jgi:hypothetical protein
VDPGASSYWFAGQKCGRLGDWQILADHASATAGKKLVGIGGAHGCSHRRQTVFVSLASLLIGERPDTAVKTGFAIAQVGTFSVLFALAARGDANGGLLYSLAVALKAVTSVLCPLLVRASIPAADWIDRHLPVRVHNALSQYGAWLDRNRKLRQTEKH